MKGFPFVTALIALIIGAKFNKEIIKIVKDLPVVGDLLFKDEQSV